MRVSYIRQTSLPRIFTIMQGLHNTFNTLRLTHQSHMQEIKPTALNSTVRRVHDLVEGRVLPLSSDLQIHLCLQKLRHSLHASFGHPLRLIRHYFYISPATHPLSILSFLFTHTSLALHPLYAFIYIPLHVPCNIRCLLRTWSIESLDRRSCSACSLYILSPPCSCSTSLDETVPGELLALRLGKVALVSLGLQTGPKSLMIKPAPTGFSLPIEKLSF